MVMTETEELAGTGGGTGEAKRGGGWVPWLGVLCRLVLAGVWITAGALKLPDLSESVRAVQAYQILPHGLASTVGRGLPFLEIAIGLLLLAGLLTRYAAGVSALMQLAFIIGISSVWARGLSIDCGCFGNGGQLGAGESPNYFWDVVRDVALFAASVILVVRPRTPLSVDRWIRGTGER